MSKRSKEAALKAYPKEDGKVWTSAFGMIEFDRNATGRKGFQEGYEQAEKDTIERVCKWLEKNVTYTHPRKGTKTSIVNLNALREAMEEEL